MLAGIVESRAEAVNIYILNRQFVGEYVEHVKVNVVKGIHQTGHADNVFEFWSPRIGAARILDIQGGSAGSHINIASADFTVQLTIISPSIKADNRRGRFDQFCDQIRIELGHFGGIVDISTGLFKQFQGFRKIHLYADFGKDPQTGFMYFYNIFIGQRLVLPSGQAFPRYHLNLHY